MRRQVFGALLATFTLTQLAHADDPSAGNPSTSDSTWASRGQAGYTKTGGNTDTSSANYLFHIAHVVDDWKFLFGTEGLYGSTKGETTAQAWDAHFQANYNITPKLYWYSGLSYTDNKFSGFTYQELVSTGLGYQFFKTDTTKLTAQLGVGARRQQEETNVQEDELGGIVSYGKAPATTGAVVDAAVNLDHSFNSYTKLIAGLALESGAQNTTTTENISLQVKMSNKLALAVGYQLVRNSSPPAGVGRSASLTTLNLVYELKNPNLAPE
jgi:putative salt-induced outer membrane protein